MHDPNLTGHSVLIVEPRICQFVSSLQGLVEQMGAETLIVRESAGAIERIKSFRFSACVARYDEAQGALDVLLAHLAGVPTLLYGSEGARTAAARVAPQLPFAAATVGSIVGALAHMLSPVGN